MLLIILEPKKLMKKKIIVFSDYYVVSKGCVETLTETSSNNNFFFCHLADFVVAINVRVSRCLFSCSGSVRHYLLEIPSMNNNHHKSRKFGQSPTISDTIMMNKGMPNLTSPIQSVN